MEGGFQGQTRVHVAVVGMFWVLNPLSFSTAHLYPILDVFYHSC
jgi:hypothetical protein